MLVRGVTPNKRIVKGAELWKYRKDFFFHWCNPNVSVVRQTVANANNIWCLVGAYGSRGEGLTTLLYYNLFSLNETKHNSPAFFDRGKSKIDILGSTKPHYRTR
jgi:hypothetical protein